LGVRVRGRRRGADAGCLPGVVLGSLTLGADRVGALWLAADTARDENTIEQPHLDTEQDAPRDDS
jgi:hypothetical protein